MTTNGLGNVANFANIVYDSNNNTSTGRKRIGISATEIELLDDIPPINVNDVTTSRNTETNQTRGYKMEIVPSSNGQQKQQNNYQSLALNRGSSKPSIVYQDENNPQTNTAFDKLIEKYAPDAVPSNLLNGSNKRQTAVPSPPTANSSQVNAPTSYNQPGYSAFQTTSPPSSTASHSYSTIIRSNNNQPSQNPTQSNTNNLQTSTRPKSTNYDSFQHVVPPQQQQQAQQWQPQQQQPQQWQSQQQQQQPQQWQQQQAPQQQQSQFQNSIPIKIANGNVTRVVPGKLYNLDDDPLHLLFDRQNPLSSRQQQQPPPPQQQFTATFQPSNNFSTVQNPPPTIYSNIQQGLPFQTVPITTNSNPIPNTNGIPAFDLGNIIKRVQQDYLREIQPFVSSVKFIEKDQEYGQNITDIGFTTPVTVRKGFRTQADDILRRSFNRQNRTQPTRSYDDDDDDEYTYTDSDTETYTDDISELPSLKQREKINKKDSKESISSVTSVTTNDSEYDNQSSFESRPKKQNKGTSPPPQQDSAKSQSQRSSTNSSNNGKQSVRNEDPGSVIRAPEPPSVTKMRRLSSNDKSTSSSHSHTSDSDSNSVYIYNDTNPPPKSQVKPSGGISSLASTLPVVRSNDEAARDRNSTTGSQVIQRSEDIHPTPPTIRPGQPSTQTQLKATDTDSEISRTNSARTSDDDDDDDRKSADYNGQPQAPATGRSDFPQNTNGRGASVDVPGARGAPTTTTTTNSRDAVGQNPPPPTTTTTARGAIENSGRQPGPNIHFVPQDQRATVNERGGPTTNPPTTTSGPTQTGSTRFFQTDNDNKSGAKRTIKDAPAAIGSKIKSLFGRK